MARTKAEKHATWRRWYDANKERVRAKADNWNKANPEKRKAAAHARYEIRHAALNQMKSHPCMDCGGKFSPCAMDFDHRPGEIKVGSIAILMAGGRMTAMKEEVKKCDLVCANCHRVRTYNRGRGI